MGFSNFFFAVGVFWERIKAPAHRSTAEEYISGLAGSGIAFSNRDECLRILDEVGASAFECFNITEALQRFDPVACSVLCESQACWVTARVDMLGLKCVPPSTYVKNNMLKCCLNRVGIWFRCM